MGRKWELIEKVDYTPTSADSLKKLQDFISYKILADDENGFRFIHNEFRILFYRRELSSFDSEDKR